MIIDDFSNPKRKLTVSEASAANDYFTRRKSEEDRIAGVKAPAKNKKNPANTDYAKKRKQQDVDESFGRRPDHGRDERHDLDPTDWYIVKDGKMFAASIYPRQVKQAIAQGFSRTKQEARARASSKGVAEMDSSGPKGRMKSDGTRSHSTYGSRDHYSDADPQSTAKPVTVKDFVKNATKILTKHSSKTKGVADDGRKQQFRGTGNAGMPRTDDDGNVLEQGVAEGSELKQAKRKYNQAAKDANLDQVGAGKKIDTMKNSLRQRDVDNKKQDVAEGSESPEKEIERLKLRQDAEHGHAPLRRQAATQARIRELEKQIKGKQGVAEGSELKQAKRKYNQAAKDANADQVGAGKKIDTMKNSLRQKDVDNKKQGVAEAAPVNTTPEFTQYVYSKLRNHFTDLAQVEDLFDYAYLSDVTLGAISDAMEENGTSAKQELKERLTWLLKNMNDRKYKAVIKPIAVEWMKLVAPRLGQQSVAEGRQIDEVFADQGSGSSDRDNAEYMKRRKAAKFNISAKPSKPKNQQEYDAIEKYRKDLAQTYNKPKKEQGVAEGEYDSRKPFGVRYKVFAGREGRMTTREYWTSSEEKLQKAVDKIQALDNFYEIDGYSYPKESQGVTEVFADQGSGSSDRDNAEYMKRRKAAKFNKSAKPSKPKNQQEYDAIEKYRKDLAQTYNKPKKEQGVAEGLPGGLSKSDYTPGATKKHVNTNCTTCHGRKGMYKLDGKLFADNKVGAVRVKCPACHGTGDKTDVSEAKNLKKRVKIVKGPDAGKTGWIREIKHGAFKGAPKSYYIDLDDGGQANNLPGAALRLIKDQSLSENAEDLHIGDPVIITGNGIKFEGATGEIVDFGQDNRFVVVNLYNHGRHSFHSSDVSFNEYAGSDDEEARMYDAGEFGDDYRDEMDEARMSAAQRLSNAWDKQRAKSNASLARTPSSIPKKEEPKKADPVPKTVSEHRTQRRALMAQMLNSH